MTANASREYDTSGPWGLLFTAWVVALASTLGALFIGEIMGQTPCFLCWFQRAFMFPLAVILAIACYRADLDVWRYALPMAVLGGSVATLHSLQYLGVVSQALVPCGAGPSCTGADMTVLGGLPLPLLSCAAFAMVTVLLLFVRRRISP